MNLSGALRHFPLVVLAFTADARAARAAKLAAGIEPSPAFAVAELMRATASVVIVVFSDERLAISFSFQVDFGRGHDLARE